MKKRLFGVIAGAAALTFALSGCTSGSDAIAMKYDDMINADGSYDESLFYRNELETECADPGAFYVSEEESATYGGWYYMFATSDATGGARFFDCWRSRDLTNWENMTQTTGQRAFAPSEDHYGYEDMWAPEVIFDKEDQIFYMFYSCNVPSQETGSYLSAREVETEGKWVDGYNDMSLLGLASSSCPWGPYEPYDYDADDSESRSNAIGRVSGEPSPDATPLFDNDKLMAQARIVFEKEDEARRETGYEYWYEQYLASGASEEDAKKNAETLIASEPYTYSDPDHGFAYFTEIDPSPYVAPDGTKYLLFNRNHNASFSVTNVWGIKMNEWWDPDYSTLAHLTETGYMTVTDVTPANTNDYEQSIINEGPFMVDYEVDGKTYYSLMFSVNGYAEKNYGVWQAIGDSPLGTFTKLPEEEGGLFLTAMDFNYISGTGHHSIVQNGEDMYVIYHQHINPNGSGQRAVAADRVKIVKNNEGTPVLYVNGPTVTLQPKIDGEYADIAADAEVSVSAGENAAALTDGLFSVYSRFSYIKEYTTTEKTTITLRFAEPREVTGIMICNSRYFENAFFNIARIEFDFTDGDFTGTGCIDDLAFDWDTYCPVGTQAMRPGGSAIAVFNPIMVSEIRITVDPKTSRMFEEGQTAGELDRLVLADDEGYVIDGVETLAIGEIVVLGK